jgi:hypothetical protein
MSAIVAIVTFLYGETEAVLAVAIAGVILYFFRRNLLVSFHRFYLWATNKEVQVSRITFYLTSDHSEIEEITKFFYYLKSKQFEVISIDDPLSIYGISKYSLLLKVYVSPQIVSSEDSDYEGLKIKIEIRDLRIPYRSGLPTLDDILTDIKTGIDRSFHFRPSSISLKTVVPVKGANQYGQQRWVSRKIGEYNINERSQEISFVRNDPKQVVTDMRRIITMMRQPDSTYQLAQTNRN